MKHIKKSFVLQMKSNDFEAKINNHPSLHLVEDKIKENLKAHNGKIIFSKTTDDLVIGSLVQKAGNDYYLFPVPDPTLVYFHNAQMNLIQAKKLKVKLMSSLRYEEIRKEIPIHDLYNYYGYSTSVVINLFTALESFLNQQIPTNYIYIRNANKCTEYFDNKQILEFIDFKTKLTKIIPDITKKNFMSKSTPTNAFIWNLKEFRDEIIHTKPKSEAPLYNDLMKQSLKFNYDKAIESVAKLMNFYQPEYITECDCGKNY